MTRPIRIQYPGAFYHIMTRGNERSNIFKATEDYQDFLLVFFNTIKRYNWDCYAYCLMPNHYHLLIKTNEANLSIGMRQLNGIYTQSFNVRNKRVGHLFQGRFKSILVEEELYKYRLIRYIALNPLRANIVQNLEEWRWNSCLEVLDKIEETGCVNKRDILLNFDQDKHKAKETFLDYLASKIEDQDKLNSPRGGIILGSDGFVEKIKEYFKIQERELEIPVRERLVHRQSLEELFLDKSVNRERRNDLIYKAHIDYGYSMSEIARAVNLHYTSISVIISNILKSDDNDKKRKPYN
jgi:putative transposase